MEQRSTTLQQLNGNDKGVVIITAPVHEYLPKYLENKLQKIEIQQII